MARSSPGPAAGTSAARTATGTAGEGCCWVERFVYFAMCSNNLTVIVKYYIHIWLIFFMYVVSLDVKR